MSDYEATAYLSLEKLKVSKKIVEHLLGKTHVGVSAISGQNQTRVESTHEVLARLART